MDKILIKQNLTIIYIRAEILKSLKNTITTIKFTKVI